MSDNNKEWFKMIKVRKPVKKVQRTITIDEENFNALTIITSFINSSSISDTIDQLLATYVEFGEIKDLDGNILKIKDIVKL